MENPAPALRLCASALNIRSSSLPNILSRRIKEGGGKTLPPKLPSIGKTSFV